MQVEIIKEARCQYLYISAPNQVHIAAARYLITPDRYSPWLVTHGKEYLPQNPIKRGIYLTNIFKKH